MKKIYTLSIPLVAFLGLAAMAGYIQSEKQNPAHYPEPGGVVMIPLERESRNEAEQLQWKLQFEGRWVPQWEPIAVEFDSSVEEGWNSSEVNVAPPSDAFNAPEEPSAYNLNSLRMVRSTSDEFRIDEEFEFWSEGAQGAFYSGEKERRETEKYAILLSGNGNAEDHDRPIPQAEARFSDGKRESSPKEYNGECEKVSPSYKTGMKYGIYTKTIIEPSDSQGGADGDSSEKGNGSGILAVCRIDANGPEAGTRDPFPDYTAMLPARKGVLFRTIRCGGRATRTFVGEPVIIVLKGGDNVIPAKMDGEGDQKISFYGVVCRKTNRWSFRAKDDGFDAEKEIRKWSRKQVNGVFRPEENGEWEYFIDESMRSSDPRDTGEITFDLNDSEDGARWWVRVEYLSKRTGNVLAKAEIHSLAVERRRSTNVPIPGLFTHSKARGARFDLVGKCDSSIEVDAAVYVQRSKYGARGRVSLDGYPQNEYWIGEDDSMDAPQMVQLDHEWRIFPLIQGYRVASRSMNDFLSLRVDGQALLETCNRVPCGDSGFETFPDSETPVQVRWELADREKFLSIDLRVDPAKTGVRYLRPNDPINKIENPAGIILQEIPSPDTVSFFRATSKPSRFLSGNREKLQWEVDQEVGEGSVEFFQEDKYGPRARVYGTGTGDIVLGARLKWDISPAVTIRARVVEEQILPVRVNLVALDGNAALGLRYLQENYAQFFRGTNTILRQVGIRLSWDSRSQTFPVAGRVNVVRFPENPGLFVLSGTRAGVMQEYMGNDEKRNELSRINQRSGTVSFTLLPTDAIDGEAENILSPENVFSSVDGGTLGDLNEISRWETIRLHSNNVARAGNSISSLINFSTFERGMRYPGGLAETMAHETLHGFQIAHTYCSGTNIFRPGSAGDDGRTLRIENLMSRYVSGPLRLDIDLLQLKAMGGSRLFASSVPGDVDGDGRVSVSDVIRLSAYLYGGGLEPDTLEQGDANGDGAVNHADVLFLSNYLYQGGPAPGGSSN